MNTNRLRTLTASLLFPLASLGCINAGMEDQAGSLAIDPPEPPSEQQYYVFRGDLLREANDTAGTCNDMGGCQVTDDRIDLAALGFTDEESSTIKTEARSGMIVFVGKVTPLELPPNQPQDGLVPASLKVAEVWRAPRDFGSTAPLFKVRIAMTLPSPGWGDDAGIGSTTPYVATVLNSYDGSSFQNLAGVRRIHRRDVTNRGGLIVQGAFTGEQPARFLWAQAYFRRWVPAAQYECDAQCGGLGTCLSCSPGRWSCLDTCTLGHQCAAGCGPMPAIPAALCPDGTTPGLVCEPQEDDRCGWTLNECSE